MKTRTYTFDVKLFASLTVTASSRKNAQQQLQELLDCASANFGADDAGNPIIAEVSLDTEDGAELVSVDGEYV